MGSELRAEYHRDLDRLDVSLGALLSVVPDAVGNATEALLSADSAVRLEVDRWRAMVEEISAEVDHTAEVVIARQAPVAGDLRFLMTCVRLVPNLFDTIDLVGEVGASGAAIGAGRTPERVQDLIAATGDAAAAIWRTVSELWHQRDAVAAGSLRVRDDRLSEARSTLGTELTSGGLDLPVAVDLAGAARCYERIGRHAIYAGSLITSLVHPTALPASTP